MTSLGILFVYRLSICAVQESWENYGAVQCIFSFYRKVIVELIFLQQPTEVSESLDEVRYLVCLVIVEARYMNFFNWVSTWTSTNMSWLIPRDPSGVGI